MPFSVPCSSSIGKSIPVVLHVRSFAVSREAVVVPEYYTHLWSLLAQEIRHHSFNLTYLACHTPGDSGARHHIRHIAAAEAAKTVSAHTYPPRNTKTYLLIILLRWRGPLLVTTILLLGGRIAGILLLLRRWSADSRQQDSENEGEPRAYD